MKSYFLSLAVLPLLLTGCGSTEPVGYYPPNSGPGYYAPDYYSGPDVSVAYYNGGYNHEYHHYANNYHHAYASNTHSSYHGNAGPRVASATGGMYASGSHAASSSSAHVSSGHHPGE